MFYEYEKEGQLVRLEQEALKKKTRSVLHKRINTKKRSLIKLTIISFASLEQADAKYTLYIAFTKDSERGITVHQKNALEVPDFFFALFQKYLVFKLRVAPGPAFYSFFLAPSRLLAVRLFSKNPLSSQLARLQTTTLCYNKGLRPRFAARVLGFLLQ